MYRAISVEPVAESGALESKDRLKECYDIDKADAAIIFENMFPSSDVQAAAVHSAISDLFVMMFCPSIYRSSETPTPSSSGHYCPQTASSLPNYIVA
ncbi:uncharacterized protein PHALS_07149 [Plasmopara halstedii]|uniref:Uncharacterized protein n=1 Tax=Plasmopara halstedii TaxID=4781 RepID=A0A0P1B3N4_PLAHL|nr:uncharacterized protein PHALS_07149 [Plasmopara halstedii]CEG49384.1 hypothetical protein PHALS_07149 [Plasmopara halstedii]|eukprot:XP_024585753.1 hypothetical protein PHALS_07149 [Plasmopara halstedii]